MSHGGPASGLADLAGTSPVFLLDGQSNQILLLTLSNAKWYTGGEEAHPGLPAGE